MSLDVIETKHTKEQVDCNHSIQYLSDPGEKNLLVLYTDKLDLIVENEYKIAKCTWNLEDARGFNRLVLNKKKKRYVKITAKLEKELYALKNTPDMTKILKKVEEIVTRTRYRNPREQARYEYIYEKYKPR